jgi:DNA-binding beta-propeller fold protein YncE
MKIYRSNFSLGVLKGHKITSAVKIFATILVIVALAISCAMPRLPKKPTGEYVWPPPPNTPRIKWLTQWSNQYDFKKPNLLLTELMGPEKIWMLIRPMSVVADSAGNVYVTDSELRLIFVFDQEKQALRLLGRGTFSTPIGLAMDNKRGILFVSDSKLDKVFGLNKDNGKIILSLGTPGEYNNPSGLAYDEERERLYVSDTKNNMVRVFDKNGNQLFTIGKRGQGDGEFNMPSYLAVDRNGRLYVVDSFNFRVQIFDTEGKFLKKFGKVGDASGQFARPYGIGVDSEDHIYVVDSAFNNFQIFNEDGKLLLWVGQPGKNPGEFYLPTGMYIDKQDRIYVADTFNYRVQVFQYLKETK